MCVSLRSLCLVCLPVCLSVAVLLLRASFLEAALRSGERVSDILDPSTINLAPVPDLYEAFMKTLLKPAPAQSRHKAILDPTLARGGAHLTGSAGLGSPDARGGGMVGGNVKGGVGSGGKAYGFKGRGKRSGGGEQTAATAKLDEGLLSVLKEKLKAGVSA